MSMRRKSARADNVQSELDELQRKYRMMEVNRKTYNEDSQNTIRMQRQQIEKLKKDNDRLKEDLSLETRQAKTANNMSSTAQIAKLQDQGDFYARKIGQEKRRIEELDRQINKMESTILDQRKEMGGINASKENNQQVQKQIRILENRLDKALVKFNEALAHNKQLRETIDNLRRERVVFDGIYKKLERELHEKKNKMAEIIEISNTAYEARDQAQSEMLSLKAQADKEQSEFESKWEQLGALIEKDRKMKDFIKLKEREKTSSSKDVDPGREEEQKLRKRVTKGAWGIEKDKANIHISMEKVQSYEEAFAKIQQATAISDIDQLVQTFINAEDHNFSLFNHVNDLSNEIEKLEESIAETKAEIEKYKGQGSTKDTQRKQILEDLESQLTSTESKARQYEDKYSEAMETVHSLKSGIQNIFNKIGCNDSAISEMLGNAGVTETNMMQYLGIIEERTNELLQAYQDHLNEGNPEKNNAPVNEVSVNPPSIELPSSDAHNEYDSDEDEDTQPISVEEMNQLSKQGQSAHAEEKEPEEGKVQEA